ncbi:hypothetical protein [Kutzneria sp. CA-103260]|uniref:hypothetical protein n=1 Tax=Kutzneria sp. CA-103260 TaxID=2802641 RepID=UPI001BA7D1B2|nr:hypothetical protein [Kutzneria sp. CA-103260]QUQ67083.1 hypothetical protein JJ691_48150 [Kutzneria sp. CA-103260]
MTDKTGDSRWFVRVVGWLLRRNRTAMAVGVGLFLLAVVCGSLPPHSALLAVLFVLASCLVLTAAVAGRSRLRWLPLIVFAVTIFGGLMTSVWVGQAVVQTAGHDETCQYVNSTEQQSQDSNDVTRTSTRWVVACPDGTHTFSTDEGAEIANPDGSITMRTAGPLFTVLPVSQANDYALWYLSLSSLAVLFGCLITALIAPRPADDPFSRRLDRPTTGA